MQSQNPVTALWNNQEVDIHGGYQHPEKGFFVEISSARNETIPRQSVSVWSLFHENEQAAEHFFRTFFNVPVTAAIKIDKKKGLAKEVLIIKTKVVVAAAA